MLELWCKKWGVPEAALNDLANLLIVYSPEGNRTGNSETAVQNHIRFQEAEKGRLLFRNNVGAAFDERGNFFRYGLANETKAQNEALKSADLIGIRPTIITPDLIGKTIGQFMSIEVKKPGWKFRGTKREKAQMAWATLIKKHGGHATITTSGEV